MMILELILIYSAGYNEMTTRLKELMKSRGKRSYTFSVGKLNPAKLANFAEVCVTVGLLYDMYNDLTTFIVIIPCIYV